MSAFGRSQLAYQKVLARRLGAGVGSGRL